MTRLSDANTSTEIGLSRYFRPWTEKKDLLVLVEGDEDVFFWKKVLEYAQDKYAKIDVHTLKLPQGGNSSGEIDRKGKKALMEDVGDLGPSKVVAVDIDYDGLVNGYHSYSARINSDPCVLHTIYYAMENHKLYPDIVKEYIYQGVREIPSFDFEKRMVEFSETIAPYLLLIIVGERKRTVGALTKDEQERLTIHGFRSDIAAFKFSRDNFALEADSWMKYMNDKYGDLAVCYQEDIQSLKRELAVKGYMEKDYWKLLQGHSLAGYMLRAVSDIATEIVNKKEREIVEGISDKKQSYKAIIDYWKELGRGASSIYEFMNRIFTEMPFLSDKDSGLDLIHQQIDRIPV